MNRNQVFGLTLIAISILWNSASLRGQSADLPLAEFRPQAALKVRHTDLKKAKIPVVDCHSHFKIRFKHDPSALDGFVQLMDRNNMAVAVSLDGGLGEKLDEHIAYLWTRYRERFVIFANIDWQGAGQADRPETWTVIAKTLLIAWSSNWKKPSEKGQAV